MAEPLHMQMYACGCTIGTRGSRRRVTSIGICANHEPGLSASEADMLDRLERVVQSLGMLPISDVDVAAMTEGLTTYLQTREEGSVDGSA